MIDGLAQPMGPQALGTGLTLSIGVIPPGLAGLSSMLQAFSLAGAQAGNGVFSASDGHELRLVQ